MSEQQRMASVYEPDGDRYRAPVDKRRCRASVWDRAGFRSHQCARKVKLEVGGLGWCRQHSPEAIATRDAKRNERDAKRLRGVDASRIGYAFMRAMDETRDPEQAKEAALRIWKNSQDRG